MQPLVKLMSCQLLQIFVKTYSSQNSIAAYDNINKKMVKKFYV